MLAIYYNKFLRVWIVDYVDVFLISAFITSSFSNYLKYYRSEQQAMKRLEKAIVKKSPLLKSDPKELNKKLNKKRKINKRRIKKRRIKKIINFALTQSGGQLEDLKTIEDLNNFQVHYECSNNNVVELAHIIRKTMETVVLSLKKNEQKAVILYKPTRFLLELLLCRCGISVNYVLSDDELDNRLIILTTTTGGISGYSSSWLSFAGSLIIGPLLTICGLLIRSLRQQSINEKDYEKFTQMFVRMLDDDKVQKSIKPFCAKFLDVEHSIKNPLIQLNVEKLIKKPKLYKHFNSERIKKIIHDKRMKSKTVNFLNFIKKYKDENNIKEILEEIIEDNIRDGQTVKENIKLKNKKL